jgi:hypothetical protein
MVYVLPPPARQEMCGPTFVKRAVVDVDVEDLAVFHLSNAVRFESTVLLLMARVVNPMLCRQFHLL